jgi:hypothetical protein
MGHTPGMKNRGQKATDSQKAELVRALSVLEAHGGEPSPSFSPLIQGQWELLYTSKSAFDLRNPLGKRVDGSTPGLEAAGPALASLFGNAAAKAMDASSSPIQRTVTAIDAVDVSQVGNISVTPLAVTLSHPTPLPRWGVVTYTHGPPVRSPIAHESTLPTHP